MSEQDVFRPRWRTSSHSSGQGTQCVQVAALEVDGTVGARDSKDPLGPVLSFSRSEWGAFVDTVKNGALDLP
ncbi:hypothetical protein GCM10023085_69910 [Actinomadura viridis]|uniref:DUF397 domain-containing protein n=1 Tax=Actinomadura viridis TaxID=58110 RepID=A0A931GKB8_9ACTN|nr:DUF397 domain-containing protein [Actinomadura viridis]MBG6090152.1 hypothetical protein [Actinomadura viridis]